MDPLLSVEVTDEGVEVTSAQPKSDIDRVELLPVQGLLGVENPGSRQLSQMKEVWDHFAEGAQGEGDTLYKIKQTEMKMSPPRLGETRLSKLYNYVRLQRQIQSTEQELNAL